MNSLLETNAVFEIWFTATGLKNKNNLGQFD